MATVGFLALAFLLSIPACVTSTERTVPEEAAPLPSNEGIVILAYRDFSLETSAFTKTEEELVGCVSSSLKSDYPKLRVIPTNEFRQLAFPGLAAERTPSRPESFVLLLNHARFRNRVEKLGLRYVVVVGVLTKQSKPDTWGFCGSGYGGAGCLIAIVGDEESRLAASIFDLRDTPRAHEFAETVTGHPFVAVIGILPLYVPALTESRACAGLGKSIGNYLSTGQTPDS